MTDLEKYRKPVYNESVICKGLEVRSKNNKIQVILLLNDGSEISHRLKKEVKTETKPENLSGIPFKEETTEDISKEEINEYLPKIFKDINKYLKKNETVSLNVSYFQSALDFDGEIVIYKTMRKYHVETIYSKDLKTSEDNLKKQLEWADKHEQRKKGTKIPV